MKRVRTAILSDIHSNLEALSVVLADAEARGCERLVCLGDFLGYGPNPRETVHLLMERFDFVLMGNHEEAILYDPEGFNWKAEASAFWTRKQLTSVRRPPAENRKILDWLTSLPRQAREGDVLYVHASTIDPTHEYILPESVFNKQLMKDVFGRIKRLAFGGHTHLPGIYPEHGAFVPQPDLVGPIDVGRGKHFVNVGSVGQPRDGDVRTGYVIFDDPTVEFRRLTYDYRKTARKIRKIRGLPTALGARLQYGL